MRTQISWLENYVDISNIPYETLKEKLVMTGSNADALEYINEEISNVYVGEILEITKHKNADKLVICQVDTKDKGIHKIVTGASNMKVNDLVVVALENASLPNGIKIKKTKLRGEESFGMFLSFEELGYSKSLLSKKMQEGIIILDKQEAKKGDDIREILGLNKPIVEFEITPNRPDCLNILGLAREVKASFDRDLKEIELYDFSKNTQDSKKKGKIRNKNSCSRFVSFEIENLEIKDSHIDIYSRLINYGIRPINNLVDLSNFVMLELGQAIHCYDSDKLSGDIYADYSKKGEKIITIDQVERELSDETVIIKDDEKIVSIAGIMGSKDSEIDDNTKNALVELACFDAERVRQKSLELNLRSEASKRTEKEIPFDLPEIAARRLAYLVEKYSVGKVVSTLSDEIAKKKETKETKLSLSRVNKLIGLEISESEIINCLQRLSISCKKQDDDTLFLKAPRYRSDLEREIDYIEEIARIYGYDKIPSKLPSMTKSPDNLFELKFLNELKFTLRAKNYMEILNFSFLGKSELKKSSLDNNELIRLRNPLGEEYSIMRPYLLPGMLKTIEYNAKRNNINNKFFEIGTSFSSEKDLENIKEKNKLILAISGDKADFFELKKDLINTFKNLAAYGFVFEKSDTLDALHPEKSAIIKKDSKKIGFIGAIHPSTRKKHSYKKEIVVAEIELDSLIDEKNAIFKYQDFGKYPSSSMDFSIIIKDEINYSEIEEIVFKNSSGILKSLKLFDIYKGDNIEKGFKSMAFSLEFSSRERTLEQKEVKKSFEKIIKALEKSLNAELRAK